MMGQEVPAGDMTSRTLKGGAAVQRSLSAGKVGCLEPHRVQ